MDKLKAFGERRERARHGQFLPRNHGLGDDVVFPALGVQQFCAQIEGGQRLGDGGEGCGLMPDRERAPHEIAFYGKHAGQTGKPVTDELFLRRAVHAAEGKDGRRARFLEGVRGHVNRFQGRFDGFRGRQAVPDREDSLHEVEFQPLDPRHRGELFADQRLLHRTVHVHDPVDGARLGTFAQRREVHFLRGRVFVPATGAVGMVLMAAIAIRPVRVDRLGEGIVIRPVPVGMNMGMLMAAAVIMLVPGLGRGRRFRGGPMVMPVPAMAGGVFGLPRFKGAGLFTHVPRRMRGAAGTRDACIAHADSPYRLFMSAVVLFCVSAFFQDNAYSPYRVKRAGRFSRLCWKRFTASSGSRVKRMMEKRRRKGDGGEV